MEDSTQFPFFPQPVIGETIYSLFCRCVERTGFHDTHLLKEFTGQRRYSALLLPFPSYLPTIAAKMPEGHPWRHTTLMIRNHTAFPYFTYFDREETRGRLLAQLKGTVLSYPLVMSLGLTRSQCRAWSTHPRYCPTCMEEERKTLGFSVFRREHQLPGVAVCWLHETALAHGCNCCGPYPINGRALSMAGKCSCKQGITPLDAYGSLPVETEPLIWLAQQSAYMVRASGTCYADIRERLRNIILNRGFGRGLLLDPCALAECIELRFGRKCLQWLGTEVWDEERRPAAWVRRLLSKSKNGTRTSPMLFLLVVGSLFDSVDAFEKASEAPVEKASLSLSVSMEGSLEPTHPPWSGRLFQLLQTAKCGLPGIASHLGVPLYQIIEEIRRCRWRVCLSQQTRKKQGDETIAAIKNDLRQGVEKKSVMQKYGCSEWALTLIELDEPGLNSEYREAAKLRTQEENRTRLLQFLAAHPDAGRSDIVNALPGVYDRMVKHDKVWFQEQVARKKRAAVVDRKERVDWGKLDLQKQAEISKIFDDLLASAAKPIQVTATTVLKKAHVLTAFNNHPGKFPLVAKLLKERSEPYPDYLRRRITWAVGKMAEDNEPISVNKLRRVAALSVQIVRDHKAYIKETAQRINAGINSRSFFS